MSATLLMMSGGHKRLSSTIEKKELKDTGTCFNCKYQGEGSKKCHVCNRSMVWKYYKKPANTQDNFELKG